jgi:hypothetical protein
MSEIDDESLWNYETWAASDGVGVGRRAARHLRELGQKAGRGAVERGCGQEWLLADWLKEWVEREAPSIMPNIYNELLHAALARVDWHEVAAHILDAREPVLGDGQHERGKCAV